MIMIIVHHCIVHGLGLAGLTQYFDRTIIIQGSQLDVAFFINAFCICAVNCFILISGYFKIKITEDRFLRLIFTLLFYTILFSIIPNLIQGKLKTAIISLMIFSHSPYWFVIDYFFLMVFTPILNLGFHILPPYKRRFILLGLILISSYFGFIWSHNANSNGYTLLQFITMYCIGREIAQSGFAVNIRQSLMMYAFSSMLIGIIGLLFLHVGKLEFAWRMTYYNDPLLIISSIGLFLFLKNIQFKSKIINILAKSAFGIYLFQSSPYVGDKMYEWLQINGSNFGNGIFLIIFIIAICTALIAIIIDQVRIISLNAFYALLKIRRVRIN